MKVGVYICHCGVNIAATVDIDRLKASAEKLPHVSIVRNYPYVCSDPGQDLVKKDIVDAGIDRVVVAACSPRMHEPTFRKTLESVGLNPYLCEIANIREQCSWVHPDREEATQKATDLVAAAVAKVCRHEPLQGAEIPAIPAALVIGGGIAGLQASLDISRSGFEVFLIEKSHGLGGHLAQVGQTLPTLEETSSLLKPRIEEIAKHPSIHVLTHSEVQGVEGFVGNYKVRVKRDPIYVDPEKCDGCARCSEVCPVEIPDEYNLGLTRKRAIDLPSPFAFPLSYRIDPGACLFLKSGECAKCRDVCPKEAVRLEEGGVELEMDVGTIIVATGYDLFDPRLKPEYGYGRHREVITALEFERLVSADGPTRGKLLIDGKAPRHVVFVQCVGSRDKTVGNEYCSRVCCMYTAKQAYRVKELVPECRVTVCYIDIRAFGKGCEEFYEQVQKKGVRYRKGLPSEIYPRSGKLVVRAEDELLGEPYEEEADLVVLATGLTQRKDGETLRNLLKLSKGMDQFFLEVHPKLRPLDTAMEGIFLAGTCQGPKDIADTLCQAHGAASRATTPLFAGKVKIDPVIAVVDAIFCAGCGLCENVCESRAIQLDPHHQVAVVNPVLCKGCGACNAACPSSAISLRHFKTEQIIAQIREVC